MQYQSHPSHEPGKSKTQSIRVYKSICKKTKTKKKHSEKGSRAEWERRVKVPLFTKGIKPKAASKRAKHTQTKTSNESITLRFTFFLI